MKKIETTIHPHHWDRMRAVLQTLHVPATLREVKSFGRTPPKQEVYRGSRYVLDTTTELAMTVLVQDELLDSTLLALAEVTEDAEFLITSVERLVCGREAQAALPLPATPRAVPAPRTVGAPAFVAAMARG
jgi:nitrogen regulatory protein PII